MWFLNILVKQRNAQRLHMRAVIIILRRHSRQHCAYMGVTDFVSRGPPGAVGLRNFNVPGRYPKRYPKRYGTMTFLGPGDQLFIQPSPATIFDVRWHSLLFLIFFILKCMPHASAADYYAVRIQLQCYLTAFILMLYSRPRVYFE